MLLIMTIFDTGYVECYKKVANELGYQISKLLIQETQNQINLVTFLEHCFNLENKCLKKLESKCLKKLFTKLFALYSLFQSNIKPE